MAIAEYNLKSTIFQKNVVSDVLYGLGHRKMAIAEYNLKVDYIPEKCSVGRVVWFGS